MSRISNEVNQYIRKVFGQDLKIVEATTPLRIQPIPDDAVGASPKDPGNCVFVHTVKRMYTSQMVLVWKKFAYIDLLNERGTREVNRFAVSSAATKMLSDFDRGLPFKAGTAIEFLPPTKSKTLKANRVLQRRGREAAKKYEDRRGKLTVILNKKRKTARLIAKRLNEVIKSNIKQDHAMLAGIKQRKAIADAALKEVMNKLAAMDKDRKQRAPRTFDLSTRNGAIGNYNFSAH